MRRRHALGPAGRFVRRGHHIRTQLLSNARFCIVPCANSRSFGTPCCLVLVLVCQTCSWGVHAGSCGCRLRTLQVHVAKQHRNFSHCRIGAGTGYSRLLPKNTPKAGSRHSILLVGSCRGCEWGLQYACSRSIGSWHGPTWGSRGPSCTAPQWPQLGGHHGEKP